MRIGDIGLVLYVMIVIVVFLTPFIQVAVYLIYRKKEAPYKEYDVGLKYSTIVILIILGFALYHQDEWL